MFLPGVDLGLSFVMLFVERDVLGCLYPSVVKMHVYQMRNI